MNNTQFQRDIFIDEIKNFAKKDSDIYFISADFGAPALDSFREDLPKQFIHSGISEQHMIDIASGLALAGKRVFVYGMSPFISLRCIEQIKCSLSMMNLPVTILSIGGGLGYADAGPTHYSTEDIACLRSIVNVEILSPSDGVSAKEFARLCFLNPKLRFIRLERPALENIYKDFKIDDERSFKVIHDNGPICVISYGYMLHRAVKFLEKNNLQNTISLIDLYKIKPICESFESQIRKYKKIISYEEHCAYGGFGSAIAEYITDNKIKVNLKRMHLPEKYFFQNGGRDFLLDQNDLSSTSLLREISESE